MSYVDLSILLNLVVGVDGYKVSGFGESVHDHPNQVKLASSQQETHNEIHAYVIHFQSERLNGCNNPPGFM
jgi:hypothetical protein